MMHKLSITSVSLTLLAFGVGSAQAQSAPYAQDKGRIASLYTGANGSIAITLDGGYPNAVATGQCPTSNGFAGTVTGDKALKAALMMAKATGAAITVTTLGCETGGRWFKVADIYQ